MFQHYAQITATLTSASQETQQNKIENGNGE